jgi:hypothetical protein
MAGTRPDAVKASILAHDPTGQNTIETAMGDPAVVEAARRAGEGQ